MTLRGMMMEQPLLLSALLRYAATHYGDVEIVSRGVEGPIHRTTYAETYRRTCRLAHALEALGIAPGDRVATLAWNTHRHFELYYGVSGLGAVCHTVNPRLFRDQVVYIVNHAADRIVFADLTFVPLLEELWPDLETPEAVVVMTDTAHMPDSSLPRVLCYEELLAEQPDDFDWPDLDERSASALCYTSGTTGEPKGALYDHRSAVLHALGVIAHMDGCFTSRDNFLVIVPMFHVCAWGFPYIASLVGAKLVFPGPGYDGASLLELFETEAVTISAGVPTIWLGLLDHLKQAGGRLSHLKFALCGGASPPRSMIREIEEMGIRFIQGWGMTETSPVAALSMLRRSMQGDGPEARIERVAKPGWPPFGIDLEIVDPAGNRLPHDGEQAGELLVRGHWVIDGYYENPAASDAAMENGWFRTGDVATIDRDGFLQITDRTKDLIKSGGEWISSIDLENAVMGHPGVAQAAAIALPHPKWQERPLLVVVPREGTRPEKADVLDYLADKVAKWWLPDDVVFVDALPMTATGKVSKARLRAQFKDYPLPGA
jgi:acyl-CoA synthetase (AMP-forming)/AMP-acid ligase II